jgi:hypothetical protein
MNLAQLRTKIHKSLSNDLLKKDQIEKLTGIHLTEGHCAVAAESAYHILGGKVNGWVPMVLPRYVMGNNTHWWIKNKDTGEIFDPTVEQWGDEKCPYHLGMGCGFMTRQPSKRAKILIDRINKI